MKKRGILITLIVFVLIFATVGYDLSQISAGRETPSDTVLAESLDKSLTVSPPPVITTYPSFSVIVEDGISVDVHMRETPNATENIFMVHGAGSGAWAWEEYFEHLPQTYNLYAISWRGHFTSSSVDDANTSDYVRDQIAVINAITNRNDLPIHVIGHSFGGATSVLATSEIIDQVESLHLLAPIVPIDLSFLQAQILPVVIPLIMNNVFDESYAGMFLDIQQMKRYSDLYASKPFSVEKLGLFNDGFNPDWQVKLDRAYKTIGESDLPVWFLIARYDNVIVPDQQRTIATEMGASLVELKSGHYIQLDIQTHESIDLVVDHLVELNKPNM